VHDSNEILGIVEIPRRLAVVGAGVIGAEYASTFAALGVEVHLIDGRDVLLGFLDRDVSAAIQSGMAASGVVFHWNERVTRCDAVSDDEVRVTLSSGAVLDVTDVLVCAGRASNTEELDLAKAGLTPGPRGLIPVDAWFRTSVPNIYAAGDVAGAAALAATGMEQARIAMCHAYAILDKRASAFLPSGVYTIPEASMAGETEQALRERGVDYVVGRATYSKRTRPDLGDDDALEAVVRPRRPPPARSARGGRAGYRARARGARRAALRGHRGPFQHRLFQLPDARRALQVGDLPRLDRL
jgi:NAD(P) transhydrogenase